jgi:sirohydrochlorin cobaltochelatase
MFLFKLFIFYFSLSTRPLMTSSATTGTILFAHGSRDPQWRVPFEGILKRMQGLSAAPTSLAFLEYMTPTLGQAIDDMVGAEVKHIAVIPVFLAVGSHVRKDLPLLLAAARLKHPELTLQASAAIGERDAIQEAIATFALAARA